MKLTAKGLPRSRISRKTMRAAVLVEPGRFEIEDAPLPEPGVDDIRVQLEGCGVCASNLTPWEGKPWFHYPMAPGALGHEGWGRVEAVGKGVTDLRPGDRVTVLSEHAFAEYDVAPASCAVRLPAALDQQPFPGEPLGCAVNIFNRSDIHEGQHVAIIGIGFLGAVLTYLASKSGAHVIAVSRRPWALVQAQQLRAQHLIVMDDHQRIIEQVKQITDGAMCPVVIEAVGKPWPLDLAAELTGTRGRLVVAGYHQDGPRQVNMQLWNWRGLDVINAHERDPEISLRGIRAAIALAGCSGFDPQPLLTHRLPLDQLAQAMELAQQRPDGFLKGLIMM